MASEACEGDEAGEADAGATDRLERLYRRYSTWLRATLRHRFQTAPDEADDLVQETYIRMSPYVRRGDDRHPKALLITIARNLLRDDRRRTARWPLVPAHVPGELLPIEADQAETLLLKQVILGIPDPYRETFLLSRFTTMTYDAIAQHLGISIDIVEWRMRKALEHCARQLRY